MTASTFREAVSPRGVLATQGQGPGSPPGLGAGPCVHKAPLLGGEEPEVYTRLVLDRPVMSGPHGVLSVSRAGVSTQH